MIASKSDWKNNPMPKESISINLNKKVSKTEMKEIEKGLIPLEMEDKWFIFCEQNRIYFHRSWSGDCIYIAEYKEIADNEFEIGKLIINRNPEQYQSNDVESDKELFVFIFERLLLDKDVSFPSRETNATKEEAEIHKHVIVGYGSSRKDIEKLKKSDCRQ
ncbi:MAG: hypothetical protein CSA05_02160 [Bacteroidia bacterium]|nr:MAG: hypothetical protein CSA05_02160 [Bacteroidia bacterium]